MAQNKLAVPNLISATLNPFIFYCMNEDGRKHEKSHTNVTKSQRRKCILKHLTHTHKIYINFSNPHCAASFMSYQVSPLWS